MKKITFLFALLALVFSSVSAQTLFEWETATDNGDNITETIDGITVTVTTGAENFQLLSAGGYGGSTANILYQPTAVSSVTFTFSEAVNINSILAMEGNSYAVDYTFTPTGGSNSPVVATVPSGNGKSVLLNWTGVTSFTVTTSDALGSAFTFDNLLINDEFSAPPTFTLFEFETATDNGDNITETIDGITVTVTTGAEDFRLLSAGGYGGSTANILYQPTAVSSVTFTFSEAVDINSILAMEGNSYAVDYTFTPTGGSNSPVVASVPSGNGISVVLNWTGVTSFTVTTSDVSGSAYTFDNLLINDEIVPAFTLFEWETATDNGDNITETIDGITVTVTTGSESFQLLNAGGFGGSTANILYQPTAVSSATFTFSEAVDINSILAMEGNTNAVVYTFTPTGGSNSPVVASVPSGNGISVTLNWTGVTSFTVTTSNASGSPFAFDNLLINDEFIVPPTFTLFEFETATDNGDNITETIDGITVTVTTGAEDFQLLSAGGYGGSTANILYQPTAVSSVTFTFSEAVDINSILAMEGNSYAVDYTFTPTGGNNTPVLASVPSGDGISVALNWTGVTQFTVTTSDVSGSAYTFDDLLINDEIVVPPTFTFFEFETATDNGDNITETIDGITVTATGGADFELFNVDQFGGIDGSTGNVLYQPTDFSSVTFTFSEAVDVYSILAMEFNGDDVVYTFTPTGGSNNSPVVSPVRLRVALNWTGVTSFTVTTSDVSGSAFAFDNLSVEENTLSVATNNIQQVKVYPNPVESILYVKNASGLKSINVYNTIGQRVLQSEKEHIDMSQLSQGLYLLQINTDHGTETKRIIKM